MGIDNVIAAVLLSFLMMRRLAVRAARADRFPGVPPEAFAAWRTMALTAYDRGAAACAAKVLLTWGWYLVVTRFGIGQPWYSAVPATIFVVWVLVLVASWRQATEAQSLRERLGVDLRLDSNSR